jgi:hypothetical protein
MKEIFVGHVTTLLSHGYDVKFSVFFLVRVVIGWITWVKQVKLDFP